MRSDETKPHLAGQGASAAVLRSIADIVAGRNLRPKWLEASLRAAGVLKEGEAL